MCLYWNMVVCITPVPPISANFLSIYIYTTYDLKVTFGYIILEKYTQEVWVFWE